MIKRVSRDTPGVPKTKNDTSVNIFRPYSGLQVSHVFKRYMPTRHDRKPNK